MATEQDVIVRVGTKPLPGADKPLRDMEGSAKRADAAMRNLGQGSQAAMQRATQATARQTTELKRQEDQLRRNQAAAKTTGAGGAGAAFGALNLQAQIGLLSQASKGMNDLAGAINLFTGNMEAADKALRQGAFGPIFTPIIGGMEQLLAIQARQAAAAGNFNPDEAIRSDDVRDRARARILIRERAQLSAFQIGEGAQQVALARQRSESEIDLAGLRGASPMDIARRQLSAGQQLERRGGILQFRGVPGVTQEARRAIGQQTIAAGLQDQVAAQRKIVELEQQALEKIRQQSKERMAGLQQALQSQQQIIEAEKSRLRGAQAEFGALDPVQQRLAKDLARKVAGGQDLSRQELQFARGLSFFGETTQGQLERQGGAAGFKEIAQLLGLDKGLKEAQKQQVEIQQKIEIELRTSSDQYADAIAQKLVPEIQKLQELVIKKLRAEAQLREAQAEVQRQAQI